MAQVIDFAQAVALRREALEVSLESFDVLNCVRCGRACRPLSVDPGPVVGYRCDGPGHRAYGWRIDADGDMLTGRKGRRPFRL